LLPVKEEIMLSINSDSGVGTSVVQGNNGAVPGRDEVLLNGVKAVQEIAERKSQKTESQTAEKNADINAKQTQIDSSRQVLSELKEVEDAQASIFNRMESLRKAATAMIDADGDISTRMGLAKEMTRLGSEIDNIAENAKFSSSESILGSAAQEKEIRLGEDERDKISHKFENFSTEAPQGENGSIKQNISRVEKSASVEDAEKVIKSVDSALGKASSATNEIANTIGRVNATLNTQSRVDIKV
jgi:hypothetical protein